MGSTGGFETVGAVDLGAGGDFGDTGFGVGGGYDLNGVRTLDPLYAKRGLCPILRVNGGLNDVRY